jgi:hypothetical protein
MTEGEWSVCQSARRMLDHLKPRTSYRKLRLFAVACCRRLAPLAPDGYGDREAFGEALDVNERWADGLTTREEGRLAKSYLGQVSDDYWRSSREHRTLFEAALGMCLYDAVQAACEASEKAVLRMMLEGAPREIHDLVFRWSPGLQSPPQERRPTPQSRAEEAAQADLLREIFGNPFRPARLDPAWFAWGDGVAAKLARKIYEDRAFDRLPVLGDALEDAGCADEQVLSHCRRPGEHVRGCWAVDLLLRRE